MHTIVGVMQRKSEVVCNWNKSLLQQQFYNPVPISVALQTLVILSKCTNHIELHEAFLSIQTRDTVCSKFSMAGLQCL